MGANEGNGDWGLMRTMGKMESRVFSVSVGVKITRPKPKLNVKVRFRFLNPPNPNPNQTFRFGFIRFSYIFFKNK